VGIYYLDQSVGGGEHGRDNGPWWEQSHHHFPQVGRRERHTEIAIRLVSDLLANVNLNKTKFPVRVNPVKKLAISKSSSKLATPVEIPAKPQLSSTGFASFDRGFSSGELFDRDRSTTSEKMLRAQPVYVALPMRVCFRQPFVLTAICLQM